MYIDLYQTMFIKKNLRIGCNINIKFWSFYLYIDVYIKRKFFQGKENY